MQNKNGKWFKKETGEAKIRSHMREVKRKMVAIERLKVHNLRRPIGSTIQTTALSTAYNISGPMTAQVSCKSPNNKRRKRDGKGSQSNFYRFKQNQSIGSLNDSSSSASKKIRRE